MLLSRLKITKGKKQSCFLNIAEAMLVSHSIGVAGRKDWKLLLSTNTGIRSAHHRGVSRFCSQMVADSRNLRWFESIADFASKP